MLEEATDNIATGSKVNNVANAAEIIAEHSKGMSPDKAFVCGLLHDIGRRTGISALRHNPFISR